MTTGEPLLNTEELAAWLRVDDRTVRTLVTARKIPVYRVGRLWRFSRSEVMEALREGGPDEGAREGQQPPVP